MKTQIGHESLGVRACKRSLARPITPCFVDVFALAPLLAPGQKAEKALNTGMVATRPG